MLRAGGLSQAAVKLSEGLQASQGSAGGGSLTWLLAEDQFLAMWASKEAVYDLAAGFP